MNWLPYSGKVILKQEKANELFCEHVLLNGFLFSISLPTKVSLLGVDSLWGDCTFIPADWGLYRVSALGL